MQTANGHANLQTLQSKVKLASMFKENKLDLSFSLLMLPWSSFAGV